METSTDAPAPTKIRTTSKSLYSALLQPLRALTASILVINWTGRKWVLAERHRKVGSETWKVENGELPEVKRFDIETQAH